MMQKYEGAHYSVQEQKACHILPDMFGLYTLCKAVKSKYYTETIAIETRSAKRKEL